MNTLLTDTANLISDYLLKQVNKFYPAIVEGTKVAEIVHGRGYVKQAKYSNNWKAYTDEGVFLGSAEKQADARAVLLLYLINTNKDNHDEL